MRNLKVGDVFIVNNTKSLVGKLEKLYNIKEFGRSDATHVGVIIKDCGDLLLVAEATAIGLQFIAYQPSYFEGKIVRRSKFRLRNVMKVAKKYKGKDYGFFNYFAFALKFIGWNYFKVPNNPSKEICSEFAARLLYECSNKKIDFTQEWPDYSFEEIVPQQISMSKLLRDVK